MKTDKELPKADQVVKVLVEHFCECCETGEDGCINAETLDRCPVFMAIQDLCPDNRFVLRIVGKYMPCYKCGAIGKMSPPDTAFNAPKQPILVCKSCHSAFWRGRGGMLVHKPEDINRSFACKIVDEDGALKIREIVNDEWLESLWGNY